MSATSLDSEWLQTLPANVVALATLGSLAARLEPQLVRQLRLEFAPELSPAVEADLWFSPLVELRAPTGIVLRADAVSELRERLALDVSRLDAVWRTTAALHKDGSPVLLAEEELGWLAARGLNDPASSERAQELLRRLLATLVDEGNRDMANWARRALVRLPRSLFQLEEATMLAVAASYRGALAASEMAARVATGKSGYSWLAPRSAKQMSVGVRLVPGGVEFGPTSLPGAHTLAITGGTTARIGLTISLAGGQEEYRTVTVGPLKRSFVSVESEKFVIALPGGEVFELRPDSQSVARRRVPKVKLTYPDPFDSNTVVVLPFVIGVLAPLVPEGCRGELPPLEERHFTGIDMNNFERVMAQIAPSMACPELSIERQDVELKFKSIDDFRPENLIQAVPELRDMLTRRSAFGEIREQISLDTSLADILRELTQDAHDQATNDRLAEVSLTFARRTVGDETVNIQGALFQLLQQNALSGDIIAALDSAMLEATETISRQLQVILRDASFRRIESAWRGLQYLVFNCETDAELKIQVLPCTVAELSAEMGIDDLDQSSIWKKVVESKYGQLGGEPYSLLVVDHAFGSGSAEQSLLDKLASLGAAASCVVLSDAAPSLLGLERWVDLVSADDIAALVERSIDPSFVKLRDRDEARWAGLCLPPALARHIYGKADPDSTFPIEEDGSEPLFMATAYAMAVNIARAQKERGWPVRIRGQHVGGAIVNVPACPMPTDEGAIALRCPVALAFSARNETVLAKAGLIPVVHRQDTSVSFFQGAQSIYLPKRMSDQQLSASDRLGSALPFMLGWSRFAQTLRCMRRDQIGANNNVEAILESGRIWLSDYVDQNHQNSDIPTKAAKPLSSFEFGVSSEQTWPGYRNFILSLAMQHDFEPTDIPVTYTIRLPFFNT